MRHRNRCIGRIQHFISVYYLNLPQADQKSSSVWFMSPNFWLTVILFASVLSNKNYACIVTNIAVLLSSTTVQKLLSEIMTMGDMLLIHNEHGHQSWFVLLYTRSDIRKPNRYSSTAENSQTNWPLFLCKWYVIWHSDFCRFFFFLMSVRKDELGSEQFKQCREDVKKEEQTKV